MKKLKKINLNLDKEVISSLSGNEMNSIKGGTDTVPYLSYPATGCPACPTLKATVCGGDCPTFNNVDCYNTYNCTESKCATFCLIESEIAPTAIDHTCLLFTC